MKQSPYTKKELLAFLRMKLGSDDRWAKKALERICQGQLPDELDDQQTRYTNGVGFNSNDASILTDIHESSMKHGGHMTQKMLAVVKRKMPKYAGQLLRSDYFDMDRMNEIYGRWLEQNRPSGTADGVCS